MDICDFSSLFELSAAFCATFTAFEYTNSYLAILSKNVFRYPSIVDTWVNRCMGHLDKNTIKNMKGVDVKGTNSRVDVERAQRECEYLEKKIEATKAEANLDINRKCDAKEFCFVSLYCLMFSITMLFIGGIGHGCYINTLLLTILVISIALLVLCWYRGDKEKQYRYLNFRSLRHCIVCFAVVFVVSVFISVLVDAYLNKTPYDWEVDTSVILAALLPYSNFIYYAIKLLRKNKDIKKNVDSVFNPIEEECIKLEKRVNQLSAIENYEMSI